MNQHKKITIKDILIYPIKYIVSVCCGVISLVFFAGFITMGINFKKRTRGIVGEIIYPAYNGTNKWWQTSRWDLVVEVDKDSNIIDSRYIYDFATVKAIELIRDFPLILGKRVKE